MGCKNGQGFRFKKTLFVYAYNGFGLNKSQKLLEGERRCQTEKSQLQLKYQKDKKIKCIFVSKCMHVFKHIMKPAPVVKSNDKLERNNC